MKLNRSKEPCFFAGDKRINENAGLACMHTLFVREHNRVARELKKFNPTWDSDTVFNEVRIILMLNNRNTWKTNFTNTYMVALNLHIILSYWIFTAEHPYKIKARLIIAAMHQVITYNEYLPPLLGQKYMDRYDLNVIKVIY